MAKIIGFTGIAGAGKDTAALAMQRSITASGRECRIGSFAAPIRAVSRAMNLDPFDRDSKERSRTVDFDDFKHRLFLSLEEVMGETIEGKDRAHLYAHTVEALEPRVFCGLLHVSPRIFMQLLGTEGGRAIRPSFWIDTAVAQWRCFPGYVLTTDCRYTDEARAVDHLILVTRPGVVSVNSHSSEHMARDLTSGLRSRKLPVVHSTLTNETTQDEFEAKAESLGRALVRVMEPA